MVDVGRRIAGCDAGDVQRVPVRAYRHRHDGDAGINAGQVGGGLLVDRFGLLGVPRKPVAGIQYVGVLVAIVGIVQLKAM